MKLIRSACVLFVAIGHIFGNAQDIGGKTSETMGKATEDDIFPCYHDMHCKLGDDVYQSMTKVCHNLMTIEDWKRLWKHYEDAKYPQFAGQYADELTKQMCPMDMPSKVSALYARPDFLQDKDLFNKISKKIHEEMRTGCAKRGNEEQCQRANEIMVCFAEKINKLKMDGRCGFGH